MVKLLLLRLGGGGICYLHILHKNVYFLRNSIYFCLNANVEVSLELTPYLCSRIVLSVLVLLLRLTFRDDINRTVSPSLYLRCFVPLQIVIIEDCVIST